MKQMYEKDVAQVMEELGAVETGLRCEEVAERQNTYGRNELEEVKPVHPFIVFLSQFKDLLVIILIAAAIISMVSGDRYSGGYHHECYSGDRAEHQGTEITGCLKAAVHTA